MRLDGNQTQTLPCHASPSPEPCGWGSLGWVLGGMLLCLPNRQPDNGHARPNGGDLAGSAHRCRGHHVRPLSPSAACQAGGRVSHPVSGRDHRANGEETDRIESPFFRVGSRCFPVVSRAQLAALFFFFLLAVSDFLVCFSCRSFAHPPRSEAGVLSTEHRALIEARHQRRSFKSQDQNRRRGLFRRFNSRLGQLDEPPLVAGCMQGQSLYPQTLTRPAAVAAPLQPRPRPHALRLQLQHR